MTTYRATMRAIAMEAWPMFAVLLVAAAVLAVSGVDPLELMAEVASMIREFWTMIVGWVTW